MINLATVTCTRDKYPQILQSHSIDLFVSVQCTHYIFVEDTYTPLSEWEALLKPFYTKHKLKILYGVKCPFDRGWVNQQYLKLLAYKYIADDYIILDSKNFFIKKSSFDWKFIEGCGWCHYKETDAWYNEYINTVSDKYNKSKPEIIHHILTPFKVRKNVLEEIHRQVDLIDVFKLAKLPTEFGLYSIFTDLNLHDNTDTAEADAIVYPWFSEDELTLTEFEVIDKSKVEILGVHNKLRGSEKIIKLSEWIETKGLNKNIIENAMVKING